MTYTHLHILKILHYLGKEARAEHISSPSHIGSGTSCHMTLKCQVASFLNLVFGGDNSHLRQTWEQQRRQHEHRSLMLELSVEMSFFFFFFSSLEKQHRAKNSLICFLATRCSYCMWLKEQCWANFFPAFPCTCLLKALICRIGTTNSGYFSFSSQLDEAASFQIFITPHERKTYHKY